MSKLWGGRFSKPTNKLVEEFTGSIHFDHKLAEYDCLGSLTHIYILKKAKLLSKQEWKTLEKGLRAILNDLQLGKLKIDPNAEDIHSFIQQTLEKKVGKVSEKLHTCRSRNDQVVFDVKCFCFDALTDMETALTQTIKGLKDLGRKNARVCLPGFTHLQHAIPVRLSDHLGAYAEMFKEDRRRITQTRDNLNITFGSGALAGTFIDARHYNGVTQLLSAKGKASVKAPVNSIYTVSDRDFIIEILSALSVIAMHLSRLSEDFILWASKEFDFIDLDDAFCTGSSLMPQKKNPDVLELMRGYTGRVYGNLINVLVMMKGLPLSYNRDMQHDKEPLFDSLKVVQNELTILTELLKNVGFKEKNIRRQLQDESLYATDLSDYLVQKGVPFKQAHTIIGKLISHKYQKGIKLVDMESKALQQFHPSLTPSVIKRIIDPKTSVESKKSIRK